MDPSENAPAKAGPTPKSRTASASSASSYRRDLLLSRAMLDSETTSVYELYSFLPGTSTFSIISLKELQGFVFNQDLFATPYQQLRSAAREKRIRALSFSKAKRKSPNSTCCSLPSSAKQRRHTLYELRPQFRGTFPLNELAVDDDDAMDVDSAGSSTRALSREPHNVTIDESDEDDIPLELSDDDDEFLLGEHYSVPVTEVVVDGSEDYLPGLPDRR